MIANLADYVTGQMSKWRMAALGKTRKVSAARAAVETLGFRMVSAKPYSARHHFKKQIMQATCNPDVFLHLPLFLK